MKRRIALILLAVLALTAVAAYASGPVLSITTWDIGRNLFLLFSSVSGGTAPYTYEKSLDGGPWVAASEVNSIYCLVYDTIAVRAIDDNGAVSNVVSFSCP